MCRNVFGLDTLHNSETTTTIFFVISIQWLLVSSGARQTETVAFAYDWREVADADDFFSG